jgi:hypothetical protein
MLTMLLESIKSTRLSEIERLLDIPYTQASNLASLNAPSQGGDLNIDTLTRCLTGLKKCDALVYGSLTLALHSLDLWPQRSPESITITTKAFADRLIFDVHIYHVQNHANCNTNDIKALVAGIMNEEPDPTLPAHREHMRIQREKLSL